MPRQRKPGSGRQREGDVVVMSTHLRPETKIRLQATATLFRMPIWRVLETALELHFKQLPKEDRKLIAQMAERMRRVG